MSYTSSDTLEELVSFAGTMTVGSVNPAVMSAGSELDGACTVVLR